MGLQARAFWGFGVSEIRGFGVQVFRDKFRF